MLKEKHQLHLKMRYKSGKVTVHHHRTSLCTEQSDPTANSFNQSSVVLHIQPQIENYQETMTNSVLSDGGAKYLSAKEKIYDEQKYKIVVMILSHLPVVA